MARREKPITDAWRYNCITSFAAIGIDISKLPATTLDDVCRGWGAYVNQGVDFGTAALIVDQQIREMREPWSDKAFGFVVRTEKLREMKECE